MHVDTSGLKHVLLADRPAAVPLVANWLYGEWGDERPGSSSEGLAAEISAKLSRDGLPVHVLAMVGDVEVGIAVLKAHEMKDIFPERTPWLGSLYVRSDYRRKGIAASLVREVERLAAAGNFRQLHLQTERLDGGLYTRLGWIPAERVAYKTLDVLVMTKDLQVSEAPR
jgi:GNAT superfamily N-acetyltransferase